MQITSHEQQRVLEYVRMLNSAGYRPQSGPVEEWRVRPNRKPGPKGKLISPATPGQPAPFFQDMMETAAKWSEIAEIVTKGIPTGGIASALFGTPGTPARYEPDGPPEPFLDHMIRLSWLARDEAGGLFVTDLGRALLRAEALADQDSAGALILDAGDSSAWARVVGHIARIEDAFVVDPYLRPAQLHQLLEHTQASRFLVGRQLDVGDKATMAVIAAGEWASRPEIREAQPGSIHDRYIVGNPLVYTIGTSLNAVVKGRTTTMVMPLPTEAAEHIRQMLEGVWSGASPLSPPPDMESGEGPDPDHDTLK